MKKTLVIIPTYNEIENIESLIHQVFQTKIDLNILVVDDNSPDGTGDKVYNLINIYSKKFSIAGKTGTTVLNYSDRAEGESKKYQASFVGFFPGGWPQSTSITSVPGTCPIHLKLTLLRVATGKLLILVLAGIPFGTTAMRRTQGSGGAGGLAEGGHRPIT